MRLRQADFVRLASCAAILATFGGESMAQLGMGSMPSVEEMIEARTDVWGAAAMSQPDGASYEFFQNLLSPLRWVNTDFRHYPLVLSGPRSQRKARFVSNGSAVNARANQPPMWYEQGAPIEFFVGPNFEPFGADIDRLQGPRYREGYLPIVTLEYRLDDALYLEEAFAPVDQLTSRHGALRVRFSVLKGAGQVEARIDSPKRQMREGILVDAQDRVLVRFTSPWKWSAEKNALAAELTAGATAELTIYTEPVATETEHALESFDQSAQRCERAWNEELDECPRLAVPETIVNDAWKAALIGSLMMADGDRLNYSAGNAYAKLYEAECGDTLRSMMLFGHLSRAPAMLRPLLQFDRQATRFHVAGHKLQLLVYYYWLTRDAETIHDCEPWWQPSVELILASRETDSGLLPKDNYAGDIKEQVYSLNSNANCWRGLRDVAAMLLDIGRAEEANRLRQAADRFRAAILDAVSRSENLATHPPFLPIALLSEEPAHDPLTATRMGSYYNLISPYVIGSEVFGQGSKREDWLMGYLQRHGALSMGLIRTTPHQGQFAGQPGLNPLYGLRYQLALLRRDEREKALVGFYGHLAHGMTRDTYIGGEGSRFLHGDERGRSFYLPPNSSSNAAWLIALRHLLVQDWDLNEDGKPDTLRLLYGIPRRWLAEGRRIVLENAPTAFGPVSCRVESKLSEGFVEMQVTSPPRPAETFLLRAPLPHGWRVEAIEVDGASAPIIDGDTVDLTGMRGPLKVRFLVNAA